MATQRTLYKRRGKHFSDILKQFVFPYYNELVLNHYKDYFHYNITNKIISEFTFVGYNLAKYIDIKDTESISENCFIKSFIFLDGWKNITNNNIIETNPAHISNNKTFDHNQMRFKIYSNYDKSIETVILSNQYIRNHISYNMMSMINDLDKPTETYILLEQCETFIKELKSFIEFTNEVIVRELCEKWREDCYTYLISAKHSDKEEENE